MIFDLKSWLMGFSFGITGKPLPFSFSKQEQPDEQWETLFEGEVTTVESDTLNGSEGQISTDTSKLLFDGDDGIRLTVNGASEVYTAEGGGYGTTASFGNDWLQSGKNTTNEDGGGDYCVLTTMGAFSLGTKLYTRTPGTYTIKIERALFEPVAYLYNGIMTPSLPEWDKSVYPYAYMIRPAKESSLSAMNTVRLYVFSNYVHKDSSTGAPCIYSEVTPYFLADWDFTNSCASSDWRQSSYDGGSYLGISNFDRVWTNFDVYDKEGNLVFATSDPIPVYK